MSKLLFSLRLKLQSPQLYWRLLKPILYFFYRLILLTYGASIPLNSRIKNRPIFPHSLYGIFISGDAVIDDNVTIFQQVTIGSIVSSGSKNIGAPTIGRGTIIGAGAKVIGNIKIGENVRIGANCVVVEDVPDHATVVMHKPKILLQK